MIKIGNYITIGESACTIYHNILEWDDYMNGYELRKIHIVHNIMICMCIIMKYCNGRGDFDKWEI